MTFHIEDWDLEEKGENVEDDLLKLIQDNEHDKIAKVFPGQDLNKYLQLEALQETTPLLFAIAQNNFKCVKALLQLNASANFGWRLVRNNPDSFTRPLHYAITLNAAFEIIDSLLESSIDLNLTDGKNDTPLTLAISNGRKHIVKRLLLREGCPNVVEDVCWLVKMKREIHLSSWKDTGIEKVMYKGRNADKLANCAAYNGNEDVLRSLQLNNYNIMKRYSSHINEPPIPFIEHNFTLLHLAVLGEQEHLIDFLCSSGCDVNAKDSEGNSAIHCSAFVGNLEVLEKLISWKIDVNRSTNAGASALYIAVSNSQVLVVHKLVQLGCFRAFEESRLKQNLADKRRDKSNDPLALAVFQQNYNITKLFLESCSGLESLDELHYIMSEGNAKLANLLISHLVDSRRLLKDDAVDGVPTLHLLSDARVNTEDDNKELTTLIQEYIIRGYDINRRTTNFKSKKRSATGFTALLAAVDRKNVNVVKILIENGADVNEADDAGYSPLHWCALVNDACIMDILLAAGANIYAETKSGLPVLHIASDEGHLEVVHTLLRQDITMINWRAKYMGFLQPDEVDKYPCRYNIDVMGDEIKWCTPFQRAVYMSKVDVCKLLIMSGSHLEGLEELHYSVRQGDIAVANVLLSYISNDVSLAEDRIKNEPALSCLPCRCLLEYTEDMPKLLSSYMQRGYDINAVPRMINCQCGISVPIQVKNASLLHMAVLHDNLEMTEFLVDNGADIDLSTNKGHTPLFLAVYLKLNYIFLILLDRGADVNKKGFLPYHHIDVSDSEMELSPIGVSVYIQNMFAFQHLINADAELNGLQELNLAMKGGNVLASFMILKRLPSNISLEQHYYDKEGPILHQLIKRCNELDQPTVIQILGDFLKEYTKRGYNVNFNGSVGNVKPLLHVILEQCLYIKSRQILDIITSIENWDPNIAFMRESALCVFLSRLGSQDLSCNHKNQYGRHFCALDCAITLLQYGADATGCSIYLTQSRHTVEWKLLSTFGVKVNFGNDYDDRDETDGLYSFVDKSTTCVKKLKHMARLAVRKIQPKDLQLLGAKWLPIELKRYVYLEKLHPISDADGQPSVLELNNSFYSPDNSEIVVHKR